jgi:hypothetical protein
MLPIILIFFFNQLILLGSMGKNIVKGVKDCVNGKNLNLGMTLKNDYMSFKH